MARRKTASALLLHLCLLLFLAALAVAQGKPSVSSFNFTDLPSSVLWFDDSDTVLVRTTLGDNPYVGDVFVSTNAGVNFTQVDTGDHKITLAVLNPHNNQVAVLIGSSKKHWITQDQGKNWRSFNTRLDPVRPGSPLSFHSSDPDKLIINTFRRGSGRDVQHEALYTTNGFKASRVLRDNSVQCLWACEKAPFTTGDKSKDESRSLCIVQGKGSMREDQYRLMISDDYFEDETEPELEEGRPLRGIVNMVAATKYILAARRAEKSDELAMYTTRDTENWSRALFGQHRLEANGFTVMESTNYSVQVDVMVPGRSFSTASLMGRLYTSNSRGTNFIANANYTNRNDWGIVDFEKVQNVQGVFLTNIVTNPLAVKEDGADKTIASRITFDDGRTFRPIVAVDGDRDYELHLHSVTDLNNVGRVYSTPAPGILMGVGSVGKFLRPWSESHLYVSHDGGLTWRKALNGPHKYEVGDSGGILVAWWDAQGNRVIWYSLDSGKEWKSVEYASKETAGVTPQILTTMPDSTGKKFVLTSHNLREDVYTLYSIDFSPLDLPKCSKSDFEPWTARYDPEAANATCIMGHTQVFRRRKANAKCFVDREYEDPTPETKDCPCTEADFECDVDFIRSTADNKRCDPLGSAGRPGAEDCKEGEDSYESPSGFRKIPGNTCLTRDGVNLAKTVKRPCNGSATRPGPSEGVVGAEITPFDAAGFNQVVYLEYNTVSTHHDETIFMLTGKQELWVTHDHGNEWYQPKELKDVSVTRIYPNRYVKDDAYFLTDTGKVYYTKDRGYKYHSFLSISIPHPSEAALRFHESNSNWLLWTGCVEGTSGRNCESVVSHSINGGDDWTKMRRGVENCEFVYRKERDGDDAKLEKQVFCVVHLNEDPKSPKTLASSTDWFESQHNIFDNILNFATMSEFLVVAKRDQQNNDLQLECSVDASTFAKAEFPKGLNVDRPTAYTVLDSSTHSVFLHVTVNDAPGQEYGTLVKSNSNGTSYVISLQNVNRNNEGYADFEKMLGLEGVAIANVVSNVDQVNNGALKKLKTMISHNDGADWRPLQAPKTDFNGKPFKCDVSKLESCSLHLHGYTDRVDARDTFSSPSAIGMMIGIGTVGDSLGLKKDSGTFISRDGGISWKMVQPEPYMWEYGDQGSVIVLVKEGVETDHIWFSLDEGDSWKRAHFPEDQSFFVGDITTLPSDGSLNFLLWAKVASGRDRPVTIALDFSKMFPRQCKLDKSILGKAEADYELWKPQHPTQQDDCLFGHVQQYIRRKATANCYNGKTMDQIDRLQDVERNCTCRQHDFECDYNFVRQADGSCKLAAGAEEPNPEEQCAKNRNLESYRKVTGYRKIPLDTCSGGSDDYLLGEEIACPGKTLVRSRKGLSGAGLFFVVLIPILAAAAVGYYAWSHYGSKLGRIRLGDVGSIGGGGAGGGGGGGLTTRTRFNTDSAWVQYPVAALSAVAAVLMAVPAVLGGLYRWGSDRVSRRGGGGGRGVNGGYSRPYTSRDSFARSRGAYQAVGADESDLLGDDSEDEA